MLALFTMILGFGALVHCGPIPNNPINTTIANLEAFFEHSFGELAGALISKHHENSTESYQSPYGNIHAEVQPLNLSPLQSIAFHPSHHQLIVENETILFRNETEEVELIKIDLGTPSITESTEVTTQAETEVAATNPAILKSIPSIIVSGVSNTVESDAVTTLVTTPVPEATDSLTTTTLQPLTSVIIVTPINEPSAQISSNYTIQTNSSIKSDEEVKNKIKEVEAEPVILTVAV